MSAQELTRTVAAFGLPGQRASLRQPDGRSVSDTEWSQLLANVSALRLPGFLLAAIEAGVLPVTESQHDQARDLHLRFCRTVLWIERRLLEVAALLEHTGVDFLVLKGTAVAHLNYPDPSLRMFGDNDLLIRADQFADALEALHGAGYVRPVSEARPGFDRRFGKGATLHGNDGDELDLHRTLVFGSFGFLIDTDELFATSVRFPLGGRTLLALGPETRLLHACYHAALGDPRPRLGSVRDIAQMLLEGDHDTDVALDLIHRWQAEAVVARAVDLCRRHLGVEARDPITAAADAHVPSRREARAIASYVGANRSFAAKVIASLAYLPDIRARAALLYAAAFPEPGFAQDHGGRRGLPWLRRGVRSLLLRRR